jgi:hypothetical protein
MRQTVLGSFLGVTKDQLTNGRPVNWALYTGLVIKQKKLTVPYPDLHPNAPGVAVLNPTVFRMEPVGRLCI